MWRITQRERETKSSCKSKVREIFLSLVQHAVATIKPCIIMLFRFQLSASFIEVFLRSYVVLVFGFSSQPINDILTLLFVFLILFFAFYILCFKCVTFRSDTYIEKVSLKSGVLYIIQIQSSASFVDVFLLSFVVFILLS